MTLSRVQKQLSVRRSHNLFIETQWGGTLTLIASDWSHSELTYCITVPVGAQPIPHQNGRNPASILPLLSSIQ